MQEEPSILQMEETEEDHLQESPGHKNNFLKEIIKLMIEGIGLSVVSSYALYLVTLLAINLYTFKLISQCWGWVFLFLN